MRLLSKKEAALILGYHPEHLMRLVRDRKFPQPIRAGHSLNCAVRFDHSEIEAWIASRKAARVPA
jgi:predicted DNA-binding transcriptional regulator AlpA